MAITLTSFELLIWDFDGTLVELGVDWVAARQELERLLGSVPDRSIQGLLRHAVSAQKQDEAIAVLERFEHAGLQSHSTLRAPEAEMLRHHASKSVIISNNMRSTIGFALTRHSLPDVPYIGWDTSFLGKPDPKVFAPFRMRFHSALGMALMIGDSDTDRRFAEALGINFLDVRINDVRSWQMDNS